MSQGTRAALARPSVLSRQAKISDAQAQVNTDEGEGTTEGHRRINGGSGGICRVSEVKMAFFRGKKHILALQTKACRAAPLPYHVAIEGNRSECRKDKPLACIRRNSQLLMLDKNVVWLYVAVHDVTQVKVAESGQQLPHDVSQLALAEVTRVPVASAEFDGETRLTDVKRRVDAGPRGTYDADDLLRKLVKLQPPNSYTTYLPVTSRDSASSHEGVAVFGIQSLDKAIIADNRLERVEQSHDVGVPQAP
jgi:hypothetical protein